MLYFDHFRHYPSGNWAHLIATGGDDELLAAASACNIRQCIQRHRFTHLDIHPKHEAMLRELGAVQVTSAELVRIYRAHEEGQ